MNGVPKLCFAKCCINKIEQAISLDNILYAASVNKTTHYHQHQNLISFTTELLKVP